MFYTEEDFKSGCSFNYWYGAGSGVVGTVLAQLVIMWIISVI